MGDDCLVWRKKVVKSLLLLGIVAMGLAPGKNGGFLVLLLLLLLLGSVSNIDSFSVVSAENSWSLNMRCENSLFLSHPK